MLAALPTLRAVDFRGCETRITGPDVLGVLARVAGANLTALNLARCRRLGAADVENILACVAATCPSVTEVDVEGCREDAQLRALAVRASALCDAASPRALFEFIAALPEDGGARCSLEHLLALLSQGQPPFLVLDLVPGRNALRDAARVRGSAWVVAVLLSVAFPAGEGSEPRTFDKNEQDAASGRCAVHAAAEQGDRALLELMVGAGAALNVQDPDGNTPLLAACTAGNLELAQVLLDKGADASAATHKGNTPLLAAVAAGNARLARELAARGANVRASRKDGASVLALALLSKNEACIELALTQGPNRREDQGTLGVRASVQPLAEACLVPAQIGAWMLCLASAFLQPCNIAAWLQEGASPLVLKGEIGALIVTLEVGDADGPVAGMKLQLSHMRALLDFHAVFLKDPPVPLAHAVTQLAAQEPGLVCEGPKDAKDGQTTATYDIIEIINNPERALQWTIQGE